jgi:hypothetical protein
MCGRDCSAHLAHDPKRLMRRRAGGEDRIEVASWEVPHRQERAVRSAPAVVDRHDVGVLDPGDRLHVGGEPADERRVVGDRRAEELERHHPVDADLRGPPHHRGGTGADLLEQPVTAPDGTTELQRRVLAQDPLLERSQRRRRIDAELLDQQGPGMLVGLQCVALPAGAVQRHHQPAPRSARAARVPASGPAARRRARPSAPA